MRRFTALFLVFSLLTLSGDLIAQNRQGIQIIVFELNGKRNRGELIAVRQDALVILELLSNIDATVDIGDIKEIRIVKESKALVGLLVGGALGALIGYVTYQKSASGFVDIGPGGNALGGGLLGGLAGLATGIIMGTDEILQIEGKSEGEVWGALLYLRPKARVPDYK